MAAHLRHLKFLNTRCCCRQMSGGLETVGLASGKLPQNGFYLRPPEPNSEQLADIMSAIHGPCAMTGTSVDKPCREKTVRRKSWSGDGEDLFLRTGLRFLPLGEDFGFPAGVGSYLAPVLTYPNDEASGLNAVVMSSTAGKPQLKVDEKRVGLPEGDYTGSDDADSGLGQGRPSEAQLQFIMDSLINDLPEVFVKPLNLRIYHPDIVFENHIRNTCTRGITSYAQQVGLMRTVGHFKFAYVKFEILKITKHHEDGTVRVRWRIRGMTGWKVMAMFWRYKILKYDQMMNDQHEVWHDGFSIFCVGKDGLIHKHVATQMMPDDEPEQVSKKTQIGAAIAALIGLELAPRNFLVEQVSNVVACSESGSRSTSCPEALQRPPCLGRCSDEDMKCPSCL